MAYVLGVIFTDGNLSTTGPGTSLSITQKEPELLEKVLKLMECNAPIIFSERKQYKTGVAGAVYSFNFSNKIIYADLVKLGLTPKKSLDIEFPDIPQKYVRHFIRGCWDGDGSVYIEKKRSDVKASFWSGSRKFIEEMLFHLYKEGFKKRTIYTKLGKSFYFRFSGEQCKKLYYYLYDGVSEDQFLMRKYLIFQKTI